MDELRTTNQALQDRLESMYKSMSLSPGEMKSHLLIWSVQQLVFSPGSATGNMSLLNEMELSDSERSLNASRRPFSQIDEEEHETEHPPDTNLSTLEEKEVHVYYSFTVRVPEMLACLDIYGINISQVL